MNIDERLDPNTGLYTRHVFGLLFNHEIARTHRYPSPLVLLRITMDNNSHSDQTKSDNGAANIANVLSHRLRHVDVSTRFGDDYLVLLPATDEAGGTVVGYRLLKHLQKDNKDEAMKSMSPNIHIGLASHSGGPTATAESILVQASKALEEARHRGTNSLVNYRDIAQ